MVRSANTIRGSRNSGSNFR
ncbi:hypothetical protein Gogos_021823 [Gossypium gossypioides]|uniref:Uncharacterized protein n=1 Tax=Gossypium gossypioides TaxID=34282 RepID=A0A7J9D2T8_GOSGO|nr:hypothetical protein [Gossypium gossypioides]